MFQQKSRVEFFDYLLGYLLADWSIRVHQFPHSPRNILKYLEGHWRSEVFFITRVLQRMKKEGRRDLAA